MDSPDKGTRPVWIVEYFASDDEWYPVVPQNWYNFRYEAAKQAKLRKLEHNFGKYRPARYERKSA